ncbi:hypothetical protein K435DRAFT_79097 [Dendrothele bispora CBS 962.96]|uniref:Uncharacterized protein n=1 Tax=Dendrothele bispora (strain CBS 962.96) TaxID=1314807 RepID=A0A4S8M4M3_DENBC|nr:hypothetical protein K435DRAFT_79097 [Dendrothele bispora CBS 962.96]
MVAQKLRSSNDDTQDVMKDYNAGDSRNTHDTTDSPRSSSASEESPNGPSRNYYGNIGRLTEQDNRNIGRNIENHGICYEFKEEYTNNDIWKTVVATGTMMNAALWIQLEGSHTQEAQLQLPSNNAIIIICPQCSFDHLPSLALSVIVLTVVSINLLSFVQHSISLVFAG